MIETPRLPHLADRLDQLVALRVCQPAGDLVEKQERGTRRERPGKLEAFALEQCQAGGKPVGLVRQTGGTR
jgi:hypothetical protein